MLKNKTACIPKVNGSRLWYRKVNKHFTSAPTAARKVVAMGHLSAEVPRSRKVACRLPSAFASLPGVHSAAMLGV